MAYQGGKWTTTDDSVLPGARINVIAKERATSILSPRGIVAIPMELDWGAEDDIVAYTRRDYVRNSLYNFGFNYKDSRLRDVDELFQGAIEARIGRLNSGGTKATFDLGEAKWSGVRGNDFVVTIEADANAGYVDNPLYNIDVDFYVDLDKVTADFRSVPYGYTVTGSVYKDGVEVPGKLVSVTAVEDTAEYAFTVKAEPGTYELRAALLKGTTAYTIRKQEVTLSYNPETERTINLTKGTEKQVLTTIDKYGFVKTNTELDSVIGEGQSAQIDHNDNIFYFTFNQKPTDANKYALMVTVDDKIYCAKVDQPTWQYNYIGLGANKTNSHQTDANWVKDSSGWKEQTEAVDVTGKTVTMQIVKFSKALTLDVLKSETPETVIESTTLNCNKSVAKTNAIPTATFTISGDRATINFTNIPENATKSTRIKTQNGAIMAVMPGRLECRELTTRDIYTFYPDVASKGVFTIEALIKPEGGKATVINSCTYTVEVEGEDKEEWVSLEEGKVTDVTFEKSIPGKFIVRTFLDDVEVNKQKVRGMYMLRDTDFIIWRRDCELEITAGMKLEGGTNGEVTVQKYSDILNKLEIENFHCLGWPTTDEDLQQMAINFTERMRDEMGIKFQTVMPKTIASPNYEGIIQIENAVKDQDVKDQDAALVYWVAGQEAGCKVQDSVANMMYNGVYDIDVDYSQRDLENLVEDGYFCFHLARGIDAKQYIKVLLDINTLTEPAVDQNDDWKRNQTIRVMDQCCNDVAAIFNNNYFGKVPNTQTGREQLQNDIITHHQELEKIQAIEDFDPTAVVVERGDNKVTVLATDAITPVNAMERLYMTIVII